MGVPLKTESAAAKSASRQQRGCGGNDYQ